MILGPRNLIAIVGTGTEVGKTWVSTRMLKLARDEGKSVAARKPAQSFAPQDSNITDAELLAYVTEETNDQVCPRHRWYPIAMAPPMAADALSLPRILLADLLTELRWPQQVDIGLIETAGGLCSPIAHDADNVKLLHALKPDHVVLVADAGLGTINAIRLCLLALTNFNVTVHINRFDANEPLHLRNRQWLREQEQIETTISVEACWTQLSAKWT